MGRAADAARTRAHGMSGVRPLTRWEEIRIAQRIEKGMRRITYRVAHCPAIVGQIIEAGSRVRDGRMAVGDLVDGIFDDDIAVGDLLSDDLPGTAGPQAGAGDGPALERRPERLKSLALAHIDRIAIYHRAWVAILRQMSPRKGRRDDAGRLGHLAAKRRSVFDKLARNVLRLRFTPGRVREFADRVHAEVGKVRECERMIRRVAGQEPGIPGMGSLLDATFHEGWGETGTGWVAHHTGDWIDGRARSLVAEARQGREIIREICAANSLRPEELKAIGGDLVIDEKSVMDAKGEMVRANQRLVASVAGRHADRGHLPFPDLVQEGNVGLLKAMDRFDYRRGTRFPVYAIWWIRQTIERSSAAQAGMIRMPFRMTETVSEMDRIKRRHLREHGREPSIPAIAKGLGIGQAAVRRISAILMEPIPANALWGSTANLLRDVNAVDPLDALLAKDREREIDAMLDWQLSPREARVVRMRFGIGSAGHTLEEVGRQFGVTRERVRQIEAGALRKLRCAMNPRTRPRSPVKPQFASEQEIDAALDRLLPSRDAKIIRMRLGIGLATSHTLEEIGCQFGVTRERVRQIEARALQRLKEAMAPATRPCGPANPESPGQ